MNKSVLFLPFLGIENTPAVFGLAVFGMLAAGIGGIIWSRRPHS